VGFEILHGIRVELKKGRFISVRQKKGTKVTSPDKSLNFSFSTENGQWLTGLRVEERMILLLQESELWDIVENSTTNPVNVPTDPTFLAAYTKKSIKAKRIILDAIKDHLIPHVTGKVNAYEMLKSLTKLYQSTNENRKIVLREKPKSIKMTKVGNVVTYLTRLTQVRDELGAVGEVIADSELVRTTLNGVSKQWVVFVEGIVARVY
jgi:hypothetical protein